MTHDSSAMPVTPQLDPPTAFPVEHQSKLPRLPPGPRLPRLLQTMLIISFRRQLYLFYRRRFGPVFTTRIAGSRNVVTLSDPEHIRLVFAGSPAVFHAGEGNDVLKSVIGDRSVVVTDEDENLRARRLLTPAFNGAALRRYRTMMTEVAVAEVEQWPPDRPLAIQPRMRVLTLDIIMAVVFGMRDGDRFTELRERTRKALDVHATTVLGWAYPRLGGYPPWRGFWRNLHAIDELLFAEIAERRSAGHLDGRGDVLSRLLLSENGELSDVEIRDQLITLVIAGHETTATLLAWTFHELARHPWVLRDAQQAADSGDDDFLEAVAKETSRLRTVVPNIVRKVTEPTEVAGYLLPAGTLVAPSIKWVHHDPAVYPEPHVFRPERFIDNQPSAGTWIPFGGGVRRCLGAGFALQETVIVLREALRRYDLRPVGRKPERSMARSVFQAPARGGRIFVRPRTGQ